MSRQHLLLHEILKRRFNFNAVLAYPCGDPARSVYGRLVLMEKLYYLKVKYLTEVLGLKFDQLYVFIDLSDVQDEIIYEKFQPLESVAPGYIEQADDTLRQYSLSYDTLRKYITGRPLQSEEKPNQRYYAPWPTEKTYYKERSLWVYDEKLYKTWGAKGLALAKTNMLKLLHLCARHKIQMTVIVYPVPEDIKRNASENIHIQTWRNFAKENNITFINCFPYFFEAPAQQTIDKYFIPGDAHWNGEGHKKIADIIHSAITRTDR